MALSKWDKWRNDLSMLLMKWDDIEELNLKEQWLHVAMEVEIVSIKIIQYACLI